MPVSQAPLMDAIMRGQLEQTLRDMRAAGASDATIADTLNTKYGTNWERHTIRRWRLTIYKIG